MGVCLISNVLQELIVKIRESMSLTKAKFKQMQLRSFKLLSQPRTSLLKTITCMKSTEKMSLGFKLRNLHA